MKIEMFRSVDFWKSAVMTMPDGSFFELLRSVFGKIKTPFNKQQLLNDLETFLLRDDIQTTIASYINQIDAEIIMAVSLFGEPFFRQLENFFSGEYSGAQLQDIIVNLEERFILYRFTEVKNNINKGIYTESRLALNPVLKNILLPFAKETSALFPKTAGQKNSSAAPETCFNDLILAALYSFVSRLEAFFKSEGVIRKRVIDEAKVIFPGINLENVTGALMTLGLFYADEYRLVPDKKMFSDFCLLSACERKEYFAAALLVYGGLSSPAEILPPLFRARLREIACLIKSFLNTLDENAFYPEKTFIRIIEILKAKTNTAIAVDALFDALKKSGLIIQHDLKTFKVCKMSNADNGVSAGEVSGAVTFDSGFSVFVYPEIDFSGALNLASVSNVKDAGSVPGSSVVCFEIDKESAVRSFNDNISAENIIELLNKLSGGKANDNLIWNLNDWEKRYKDVSLIKGLILKLSEDYRYLTETKPLAGLIIETLAPGIYLMNGDSMEEASSALHNAGVDIIACMKKFKTKNVMLNAVKFPLYSSEKKDAVFSVVRQFPPVIPPQSNFIPVSAGGVINGGNKKNKRGKNIQSGMQKSINDFHAALDKMRLGDIEKNELSARIDRRLILCESQLKNAEIRYEKLEARRMDYSGKHNVAKQAISQGSPVEIVLPEKGKEKRIYGIPKSLEKDENETVLVVNTMPDNSNESEVLRRIPIAKISLLRRIKKSIFEI